MDIDSGLIIAVIGLIGAISFVWRAGPLASEAMTKPKRPSIAQTALLVACFVSIYAAVSIAQRTIGAQWSDNMNCLLGIVVVGVVIAVFGLISRALFGTRING